MRRNGTGSNKKLHLLIYIIIFTINIPGVLVRHMLLQTDSHFYFKFYQLLTNN